MTHMAQFYRADTLQGEQLPLTSPKLYLNGLKLVFFPFAASFVQAARGDIMPFNQSVDKLDATKE